MDALLGRLFTLCWFVYLFIFSLSLSLFVCLLLSASSFSFQIFFLFSLVHPVAIYLKSRKSLGGGGREFFSGGCENHVCYIPTLLPGTKRRNIQGEGRIRFPDLDLVLSHPPPPLFFTHCRSSWTSKFSSIETIPHPPFTALLGRLIELQRRISSGSDWIFPNHRLAPPTGRRNRPLGNGIECFIYTRTNTGCFIFVLQEDCV